MLRTCDCGLKWKSNKERATLYTGMAAWEPFQNNVTNKLDRI